MKKTRKYLSILLAVVMLVGAVTVMGASAITFTQLNADNVFLKQAGSTTCTLCATTMMMRRYSMLRGDSGWNTITESAVRPTAWIDGTGLKWSFTYSNSSVSSIAVGHYSLPGGSENKAKIINQLETCPEGIVIYYEGSNPHAVLITDYTNGVFYCADPSSSKPSGRIPISQALRVTINNVTAYWKVTSSVVSGPTEDMDFSPVAGDDKNAVVVGENISFWYSGLTKCSEVEFCFEKNGEVYYRADSTSSTTYKTYFEAAGTYYVFVRGYYNGRWYNSGKIKVTVLNPQINDNKNTVCVGEPITFTYSGLTPCEEVQFEFSKNGTVYYSPDSTSSTSFSTYFENAGTYYVNAAGYLDGNWCRSGKVKVEVINHSFGAWTRLNDTQHQRVCSRDSSHVEKANHTWNSGSVTKAATCTATGVKTYTCTTCGATKAETISINASNHVNTKNVAATASTCIVKGYTAGVYCNDCKKYISGHTEQALAAHKVTTINAKDATFTAEGYTGDTYCTVCKQTLSYGTVIPKLTKPDEPTNPTNPTNPTQPTNPAPQPQPSGGCAYCGQTHTGFPGILIGFFHSILALFGLRK